MRSKRTPTAVEVTRRRAQATELRAAGLTYDRIAQRLLEESDTPASYDRAAAWRDVEATLAEMIREPAESLVAMESDRLDRLQVGVWTRAIRGDLDAIGAVLRIMDRRARLHGFDKAQAQPIMAAISIVDTADQAELQRETLAAIDALLPHAAQLPL
ncbi:hypothetical protein [uncultured Jatrophihabitans sp.]|uniref:hypothetical protein n=1 Tax=uncultured Jatrophihabitans sp. TaxID=1610747 RepID=UPI0035C99F63